MFIARFFLGFGIGPKSATTPIFAAECSPPKLRGALVMQWQMWTAFGIMLGYVADLAFYSVPDGRIVGLNWRLMMGSAMLPAVVVCCIVFFTPEVGVFFFLLPGRCTHARTHPSSHVSYYYEIGLERDKYIYIYNSQLTHPLHSHPAGT